MAHNFTHAVSEGVQHARDVFDQRGIFGLTDTLFPGSNLGNLPGPPDWPFKNESPGSNLGGALGGSFGGNNESRGVTGPKTIQKIKNNLLNPALTSHYGVEIGVPDALRGMLTSAGGQQSQLNLLCSDAVLPGSNLATMEINNNYTGVTERVAYRRVFDDRINLTFYVDAENYLPIRFFEAWMSYIMNEDGKSEYSPSHNYRLRYPDSRNQKGASGEGYTATGLTITKFERDNKNELIYDFVRSYPISVNSMPVSYDASNLLKCTVSLTYLRYVVAQTRPFMSVAEQKGRGFFTKDELVSGGMTAAEADKFTHDQNTATPGRLTEDNWAQFVADANS